jgi:hypothetical protein
MEHIVYPKMLNPQSPVENRGGCAAIVAGDEDESMPAHLDNAEQIFSRG